MVMKSTMPANKIIRGHGRGSPQSSDVQQRRKNGTAAPLSSLPEVKNGCSRDGYKQGPKSNAIDRITTKKISTAKLENASQRLRRSKAVNFISRKNRPITARPIARVEKIQQNASVAGKASRLPCQMNSPRQKLAINSGQNSLNPFGVKIGCGHQFRAGLGVQPRKSIFETVAVRSPNVWRFQANQSAI